MMKDLTKGSEAKVIIAFSLPMMAGNLFQQFYNIVDSIVVGRYVGAGALAAVGSAFALMVFLTSILIGLCMGASVVFSQYYGAHNYEKLKVSISTSFLFIGIVSIIICALAMLSVDSIIQFMNIPEELVIDTKQYLLIIFIGIVFTFLYNWSAGLLRALGNSKVPLYFLIGATITNIVLDLVFVLVLHMGVIGVAVATVIAQILSSIICFIYCIKQLSFLGINIREITFDKEIFKQTVSYSVLTSVQQSIMNFGILLIQGLINSYGAVTMAAFAAAVKIDSFAYMPVQDFGNAFSTYVAQNLGANKQERIRSGYKVSVRLVILFCLIVSTIVWIFAEQLIKIFLKSTEIEAIIIGVNYLRVVSVFYVLIGFLFLFYGMYRGLGKVTMSIVLTIISLGLRVVLAYSLTPFFGLAGIWWSIPIGWLIADIIGYICYKKLNKQQ